MVWELEWGPHIAALKKRVERGDPVPALENMPTVFDDLRWVYDGFSELNSQRRVNQVPNRINVVEVDTWLTLNGIDDPDDRLFFWRMVRAMDSAWMDRAHKEIKRKMGK